MTTAVMDAKTTAYDAKDVEYLRHGDKPLLARVFTPRGEGPFPALVECHGGAWCLSDRKTEHLRHEFMASHGIVSIALDFRSGTEAKYPASVQDINYAVRWAKLHAGDLKTRPELVGLSGQSSGGHLAMLVAMRPHDPRYAAIALPAGSPRHDASVRCVVMSWPVINPLSRYRHAKRALAGANAPEWAEEHHPAPRRLLAVGGRDGRGQSDAGARARRESAIAAGDLVPGARRSGARLQGRRFRISRQRAAALRRQLPQGRRRDRTATTSRWNATPATRRICRKSAAPSPTWSSSSASTSKFNRGSSSAAAGDRGRDANHLPRGIGLTELE